MNWTNGLDISKNFYKKLRIVGPVVINAVIHPILTAMAQENRNPLYSHGTGSQVSNFYFTTTGNWGFVMADPDMDFHAMTNGLADRDNVDKIPVIDVLNGQGDFDEDPDRLMERIVPQGVIESGTSENGKSVFNLFRAGIMTGENESNETQYAGDWGELYCKPLKEIEPGQAVKLTLRTYHWDRHRATPKWIFTCLMDPDRRDHYMPAYIDYCDSFVEEAMQKVAIGVALLEGDAKGYETYLKLKANREGFIREFFTRYSIKKLPVFDIKSSNATQVMERFRMETAGKSLATQGFFIHQVTKNITAQFTTTALPGHNIDFQIKSYPM